MGWSLRNGSGLHWRSPPPRPSPIEGEGERGRGLYWASRALAAPLDGEWLGGVNFPEPLGPSSAFTPTPALPHLGGGGRKEGVCGERKFASAFRDSEDETCCMPLLKRCGR